MSSRLLVGLFGIGLDAYWPQFPGLKERLENYLGVVAGKLAQADVEVLNVGLVTSYDSALRASRELRTHGVDLLVLHVTTYALSSTVLPLVQRVKAPVIVLNLSPEPAIDYAVFNRLPDRTRMTGEWLAFCTPCSVPEISNVFRRAGIAFHQVTGCLHHDEHCWHEILGWIEAARVMVGMRDNRLGLMGHYYGGMLDVYSDLTMQSITFGTHLEHLEVDQLTGYRHEVTEDQVAYRLVEIREAFDVQDDCALDSLRDAARTSLALDRLVSEYQLGSLAYFYKGTGVEENEATIASMIVGASLLSARGVPVAGEYEVKNVQAMKIMDLLQVGGSFTEYYGIDFNEDLVLLGHDGPGHIAISEGKTKVRPLNVYHGKVGQGVSVEMAVRQGPVTVLSVIERDSGKLGFLCAQGESVPGPILEIGNTNSRYRFPCGAREFVRRWNENGPAHHCAIGVGHIADRIDKLGAMIGLETIHVC